MVALAKNGEKKKRLMERVATTSLPAVDRPNADRWNAAHSCPKEAKRMVEIVVHYLCCKLTALWQLTNRANL